MGFEQVRLILDIETTFAFISLFIVISHCKLLLIELVNTPYVGE